MILRAFLDILFPPVCHHCKAFIPDGGELHLCAPCLDACDAIVSPLCIVCGAPFGTEGGIDHRCGDCILSPPPFDGARGALLFTGPVQELVHRLKYGRRVHLRRPLALLAQRHLAPFVVAAAPDLIVPVPLHRSRLRQRGFNQAILIGEVLAKRWGVPLLRTAMVRVRPTATQVALSAEERRANVRGAFAVADPALVAGRRILLVDDVFTTGSTAAECARVLKRTGAAAVFVATVARAP
ncbi:MAG: ComF family protein [Desulfuromonadales bacterium]|nr:MAG: ComF family protein [Desulfuromonadales bacterium]